MGFLIDWQGIKRLREDHEILLKRVSHLEKKIVNNVGSGRRRMEAFAKVTTKIDPRDISTTALEKTLGAGKAELYKVILDKTPTIPKVTFEKILVNVTEANPDGDAVEVDVYNSSIVPVPIDSYIRITRNFRSGVWMVGEVQTALAQASAYGITARVGTAAGYGQAQVWFIDNGTLTNTNDELKVYNMSASAIDAGAFITIKRCSLDEDWIVDAEDCG